MIRKILLSLLIFFAATSVAHAANGDFNQRKANLAEVSALRVGYGSGTVRIVVDITKKVDFVESYAENPSRVIIDLKNAWLSPNVQREMELKSLAAKKLRIGQFDPSTVRIVIESMADIRPFHLSGGPKGQRFVIDIGNAEYKENPELNKPEEDNSKKKEQELKDKKEQELKDKKEQELKDKKEQELKDKKEQELKDKKEQELKDKKEQELKDKKEREAKEKKERELKEKQERELKKKQERDKKEKEKKDKKDKKNKDKKDKDKDKDKDTSNVEVDQPFTGLDNDLGNLTALSGKTIVIDPGHGGNDSGAIGPTGVTEKSVTLRVALELRRLLEAEGAKVILTRYDDRTVSPKGAAASDVEELGARCDVANNNGADIFISIHADAFTRPEARGTTGYYYSKGAGRGQRLADCIRRNLVEQLGTPSRGTQPCNFYVVRHTDMPATLIELGFISNREEEHLLNSVEGVQRAAQGILDGIEDYFG